MIKWDWIGRNTDVIWAATWEHIILTAVPVLLGLVIALPLGVLAARRPRLAAPILSVAGILYTVPALAMFVFMLPLTGLSIASPIVALTIYTLIILVRNIIDGINNVPRDVREAAQAMGYRPAAQLLRVELPLAMPVIIAGVRIAVVSTIGLVAISVLISWGGLGTLMFSLGFQRNFFLTPILVGLTLSIVLAVVADLLLLGLQRLLTPWARSA